MPHQKPSIKLDATSSSASRLSVWTQAQPGSGVIGWWNQPDRSGGNL
ncbi:MAG: hypothetical protein N0C86_13320 [Candidatus Thiodiazotropha taylori]|nr:hypothetical protein [Candidatus Thiodiazotropha taylori]